MPNKVRDKRLLIAPENYRRPLLTVLVSTVHSRTSTILELSQIIIIHKLQKAGTTYYVADTL